ncbi:MAG: hypothetical protein QF464_15195, partial [Myxococcota bacterium]|nr:hypothetical protein [Myxococcota bacterium]
MSTALCESGRVNPDALVPAWSRPLVCALVCAALLMAPSAWAEGPSWVITVEQEGALRTALKGDRPMAGLVLRGAAIDKARVVLSYGARGGGPVTASLTLVHPSVAAEGARRLTHVAIESTPGPAPQALIAALAARLEAAAGLAALWTRLEAKPEEPAVAPEPKGAPEPDPHTAAVAAFKAAYSRGDEGQARQLVAAIDVAKIVDPAVRFEATVVLAHLGQTEAVAALSRTFTDSWANVGLALRGELTDPKALLGDRDAEASCGLHDLAGALVSGRHKAAAEALYRAILERSPTCRPAVIGLTLRLLDSRPDPRSATGDAGEHTDQPRSQVRAQEAIDLLLPWHAREQTDERINAALSNAYRHVGDLESAIRHFHFTADKRAKDPEARFLGQLLALYLKMDDEAYWAEHWRKVVAENPEHYVGRFLLGACLHYIDEFAESNSHLDQLVGILDHEPRVYVYRAMNRFNLGQVAEARAILEEGAKLPAVDPDVYYCLGEVLRDTDRPVAIENLERYLTLTSRSTYSNPTKR